MSYHAVDDSKAHAHSPKPARTPRTGDPMHMASTLIHKTTRSSHKKRHLQRVILVANRRRPC